jgi:DnaJ domain
MATMQQVLSQAQIAQINSRASKVAYAPSITGVVALIALVAMGQFGLYGGVFVFFVGLIGTIPVRSKDKARRITPLYYIDTNERFASIQRACENLAEAHRVWYVEGEQQNWDWKRQAGAQSLVSRKQGRVGVINPPFISTNVDVCGVDAGSSKILFFPDAILVFQQGQYQLVPYKALSVAYSPTRFVEPAPPKDAEIIGYTWQYVNKNGGPDRRFSNNRQIPLALYGLIRITLSSGVGLQIQVSNRTLATNFVATINAIVHPESSSRGSNRSNHNQQGGDSRRSRGRSKNRTRPPRAPEHSKTKSAREVLGVPHNASRDDITAAYRKMARMYHPDKVAGLGPEFGVLAERRMKEINAAYEELM